jgi:hypothetical protein
LWSRACSTSTLDPVSDGSCRATRSSCPGTVTYRYVVVDSIVARTATVSWRTVVSVGACVVIAEAAVGVTKAAVVPRVTKATVVPRVTETTVIPRVTETTVNISVAEATVETVAVRATETYVQVTRAKCRPDRAVVATCIVDQYGSSTIEVRRIVVPSVSVDRVVETEASIRASETTDAAAVLVVVRVVVVVVAIVVVRGVRVVIIAVR